MKFTSTILLLALGCGGLRAQRRDSDRSGLDVETINEFSLLDRDQDGALDELEFPFSEVARRLAETGDQDRVALVFERLDESGDGAVSLLEFARSQQNRNVRLLDREVARQLNLLDLNGNGILSKDEYLKSPVAQSAREAGKSLDEILAAFQVLDFNANDFVGPLEWGYALDAEEFFDDEDAALSFFELDWNDDGALDVREQERSLLTDIRAIDLNGNREISPDEFSRAQLSDGPSPGGRGGRFAEVDTNEDGMISKREFERTGIRGPAWDRDRDKLFESMDRNGDRELSPDEFGRRPDRGGPRPPPPPPRRRD